MWYIKRMYYLHKWEEYLWYKKTNIIYWLYKFYIRNTIINHIRLNLYLWKLRQRRNIKYIKIYIKKCLASTNE